MVHSFERAFEYGAISFQVDNLFFRTVQARRDITVQRVGAACKTHFTPPTQTRQNCFVGLASAV